MLIKMHKRQVVRGQEESFFFGRKNLKIKNCDPLKRLELFTQRYSVNIQADLHRPEHRSEELIPEHSVKKKRNQWRLCFLQIIMPNILKKVL